jgi:plasmid stability protein
MTVTLNLPPELEQYLLQEASQHGLSLEAMTLQLLTNSILLKQKQAEAVNLLQSWLDDEDEEEQQETGQYLIHALDDDRLSERKLFPPEMKGITW